MPEEAETASEKEELKFKLEEPTTEMQSLPEETIVPPETEIVSDTGKDAEDLEIVACGQPQKESPTTIKVPLIMKINGTEQEFKVNLKISFEDFILKSK